MRDVVVIVLMVLLIAMSIVTGVILLYDFIVTSAHWYQYLYLSLPVSSAILWLMLTCLYVEHCKEKYDD